jgi:7-carboxy-7-deazaguanine synthase
MRANEMRGWVSEIFTSFQGEGLFAGRKHVFLRLGACQIRCRYCDTPESLVRTPACRVEEPEGDRRLENPLEADSVAALLAARLSAEPGVHAIAVTGGEPLLQADFLAAAVRPLLPLHRSVAVLLETNGILADELVRIRDVIDVVSMDVKLPSSSGERPFWEEHERFLLAAREKTLYVKVPVDDETRPEEVERAARLVARIAPEAPLFLTPILSPAGELRIRPATLRRFYDLAAEALRDVRVMPQAHRVLGIR